MIVAIFILKVAWDIIKPSLSELIDCGATNREHGQIKQISLDQNGVKEFMPYVQEGAVHISLLISISSLMQICL